MAKNKQMFLIGGGLVALLAIIFLITTLNKNGDANPVAPIQNNKPNQQAVPRVLSSPQNTKGWKTYTNDMYGISFQYPPELAVEAHEGSSNFDKKSLTLDIGTPEYLKDLKAPTETEGLPLFLRISASAPNEAAGNGGRMEPGTCGGDYRFSEYISIDGLKVTTCEGVTLGSFPSMMAVFKKTNQDATVYVIDSMKYAGSDKASIEQILSTLKLSK
jgi:hypothetical protein